MGVSVPSHPLIVYNSYGSPSWWNCYAAERLTCQHQKLWTVLYLVTKPAQHFSQEFGQSIWAWWLLGKKICKSSIRLCSEHGYGGLPWCKNTVQWQTQLYSITDSFDWLTWDNWHWLTTFDILGCVGDICTVLLGGVANNWFVTGLPTVSDEIT